MPQEYTMKKKQQTQTNREIVYYGLLKEILQGKIAPGGKLVESEIAMRFNVSRTPVREAILQLTKRGVATHKRNVGAIVKKFSNEQLIEFLDILSVLEALAVESISVHGISNEDIFYLKQLNKEMIELCENQQFLSYWPKNETFHTFLIEKCGLKTLLRIVSDLRSQIFRVGMTIPLYSNEYLTDHKDIIDELEKANFKKAGQLTKLHTENIKARYLEFFEVVEKRNASIAP